MTATLLTAIVVLAAAAVPGWGYVPPCNITRGIYAPPGPLMNAAAWQRFGAGYAFTDQQAHGGSASVVCTSEGDVIRGAGVAQTVKVGQTEPAPLKVSGWSKAENVVGTNRDWSYSLYLDLRYNDGTAWYMQVAPFSPGTHDWEYSEVLLKPEKPVETVAFYAFVRNRAGKAWFDDLYLGPPDGRNLLRNPGFEPADRTDPAPRERMLATFEDLNANAIHTYLSGAPTFWRDADGKPNPDVQDMVRIAAERGMGVWVTTGEPPAPQITGTDDPDFPHYECVNGPWGEEWTRTLGLAATYGLAGLSLVPDEYNWLYHGLKDRMAKHPDQGVKAFYEALPVMCNCGICQGLYEKRFGAPMPDLPKGTSFPTADEAYLKYLKHRYDSTTRWLTRSAAAVHDAGAGTRADSLICVTPLCSDFWWGPGIAWDRLAETGMDFPTTDPYIQLHNYLGDSTHWYVTETAAHLTGSTPKRQCGIVLEASRLRKDFREMDPVEVYGSALSAVAHGAKELAWWHYSHLTNESPTTNQPELSRACVRAAYGLLKQADPWLGGLKPLPRVAYLHSRASDDAWRFQAEATAHGRDAHATDVRYAAVAQKEVLYYLLRRGIPTDLYYLDSAKAEQLAAYPVIVVPFPLAISDAQAAVLAELAQAGKTVIVLAECGQLDGDGFRRQRPVLLDLLGLTAAPTGEKRASLEGAVQGMPDTGNESFEVYETAPAEATVTVLARADGKPVIWEKTHGKGRVIFLAGAFGYDLPLNRNNQKRTHAERIQPDPLQPGHVAVLDALMQRGCGEAPWVLDSFDVMRDVEATCLTNDRGDLVVLAINWDSNPAEVALRFPRAAGEALEGFRITEDGGCHEARETLSEVGPTSICRLRMSGGEAGLWRVREAREP